MGVYTQIALGSEPADVTGEQMALHERTLG